MAKARKWSNLEGQLPAPAMPDDYATKILARKDALRAKGVTDLAAVARQFLDVDEHQAEVTEQQANLDLDYAALESLAREFLQATNTDLWRGEGMTLSPRNALHASTSDRAALNAWARATERDDLLTVLPGTVTSLASEAMDLERAALLTPAERATLKPGEPGSGAPPPGVTVYLRPTINRRKA